MQRPIVRPIVTLTSDFGTADAYVAAMKAAILRQCPEARLIDVTHEIPPQDILAGSITLERAVAGFAELENVVHLCVVDPGVGTQRRIAVARTGAAHIVCPDNGLLTWTLHRHGLQSVRPAAALGEEVSPVFHGRDIMAPLAGRLAAGRGVDLGDETPPVLLDIAPAPPGSREARIIHIDAFGNCMTNLARESLSDELAKTAHVIAGGHDVGPLRRTYADAAQRQALALVGSSGLVEIAVRNGSAARELSLSVGSEVRFENAR